MLLCLLTYLLYLLYLLYLVPSFKAFWPEAHAPKHAYALKETRFTVYRYTGKQQSAGWGLQAAGWVLQAGSCRLGAASCYGLGLQAGHMPIMLTHFTLLYFTLLTYLGA